MGHRVWLRRQIPDILAISVLLMLPPLVFWAVWAPNAADRVMFGGDLLMGAYPTRVLVHRLFGLGELPLWNAYQLGGMPLLADVQAAVFYVPNLLLGAWYAGREIPYLVLELLVIAHYALGAIGLYAFLRGLGVRPAAALVGAAAFEFNGFFVGHRGHATMLATVAWAPGVLWLLDGAWRARDTRRAVVWAVAAGVALSQLVMAGHPQAALYCAALIGAYMLWRWWQALRATPSETPVGGRGPSQRGHVRVPLLFGLAGALAAGLAAVALLPAAELLARSVRNEPTYAFTVQFSLSPRHLIGLLVPDLLQWSGTEFRLYAGILTLVLAAAALVVPVSPRPEGRFFLAVLVVALVVALGGFTAAQGVLYALPGFGAVRVSARAFFAANLALAVLAAFGAETLLRALLERERLHLRRLVFGLGALLIPVGLVAAWLYVLLALNNRPVGDAFFFAESLFERTLPDDPFLLLTRAANQYLLFVLLLYAATLLLALRAAERLRGRGLALALVALTVLDVATFAPQHDTIAADPDTARLMIQNYTVTLLREDWQIREQDALLEALRTLPDGMRVDNRAEILPDNYSAVWGIPFATGYNVLDLRDRFEILTQWPHLSDTLRYDLLNVGYILTAPDQSPPEPGAQEVVATSMGQLWRRASPSAYARFSTRVRPAQHTVTINGLLQTGLPLDIQPAIASSGTDLRALLGQRWPGLLEQGLLMIGRTGVQSPVDISVLAGGPIKYSAVVVDGQTVTLQQRGVVLAQIDPRSGRVIWAGGFDTYQLASESDRMAAMIEALPPGTIVALATYDEGTARLTPRARAALQSLGAHESLEDRFGAAYALIGVKGAATGTALEQVGMQPLTLDVGLGAMQAAPDAAFRYELVTHTPGRMTLLVQNRAYGLLSVSETDYPGWEAYVDGVPTPIVRANGVWRAVVLSPSPSGRVREVTFVYRPLSVHLGGAISLVSVALALGLLAGAFVRAHGARRSFAPGKPPQVPEESTPLSRMA